MNSDLRSDQNKNISFPASASNSALKARRLTKAIRNARFGLWQKGRVFLFVILGIQLLIQLPREAFSQIQQTRHQLVVEKIELKGNSKTRPNILLNYISFRPGDPITPELIEQNWQRLEKLNFFKKVDIFTRPGSEKGKVVVIIEVEERRWPYFQFEGGHSDLSGWYFVPLSFRFDNMLGKGNFWGFQLFFGDRTSKISFNYFNPSLFENSAYLKLELFGGGRQFIHYVNGAELRQQVGYAGLRTRFGGNHGLFKYLFFGFRSETYEPEFKATFTKTDSTLTSENFPQPLFVDLGRKRMAAFSLGLQADFRDNPHYPLKGIWGAFVFEKAHKELASELNFSRMTADIRLYQRLWGKQVLALHFKAGYTTEAAPFYQRFYLGGANSLRGYPERRLTPIGYGTKLFLTQIEFRFPFSSARTQNPPASGVLFFDAGGIWQTGKEPDPADLFKAAGFGFRFKLPIIGITRIDFSFPFTILDENDFQLQLSLGHAF